MVIIFHHSIRCRQFVFRRQKDSTNRAPVTFHIRTGSINLCYNNATSHGTIHMSILLLSNPNREGVCMGLTVLLLVFMIVFLPNFCLIEPFSMAEEDKGQGIYLACAKAVMLETLHRNNSDKITTAFFNFI